MKSRIVLLLHVLWMTTQRPSNETIQFNYPPGFQFPHCHNILRLNHRVQFSQTISIQTSTDHFPVDFLHI